MPMANQMSRDINVNVIQIYNAKRQSSFHHMFCTNRVNAMRRDNSLFGTKIKWLEKEALDFYRDFYN